MKRFLSEDFLLQSQSARKLYHECAAGLPIIDYHSHIPPDQIANNHNFSNMTEIWLSGDHYKWRAMRTLGIDETYITGQASDREKFRKWAYTVPHTMRNPLYHWTHMELKTYFGIDKQLNPDTADEIYDQCHEMLQQPEFSANNLLKKLNVEVACSTDDPVDDLAHHKMIHSGDYDVNVLPTFRPDKAYSFEDPDSYNSYLTKLEKVSGMEINSLDNLLEALEKRIEYFNDAGCRASDHGLEKLIYHPADKKDLDSYFKSIRNGDSLSTDQINSLTYFILLQLGRLYHKKGWVQQFHLGALRNGNTRMYKRLGADTGFDSIGNSLDGNSLNNFFDSLDVTSQLPRTILYNLNPSDNPLLITIAGNFNDGSVKGKVQHGPAWWFLDQKDGIEDQLNTLSRMSLLSSFVGMLTDSRSFLSYTRHDYFRRILCNVIGYDVEKGELPADYEWLGKIVSDLSYYNAKEYFGL